MKKYRTLIIVACIIVVFLAVFGIHIPFVVVHIQKQIKVGESVAEVVDVIADYKIQPDICSWQFEETEKFVFSYRKKCEFPSDKIPLDGNGRNFEQLLVYVGPGFLKNDFIVTFNNVGNVISVSDVRRWD